MEELKPFLDANKKDIVDFVESNQRPMAIGSNAYARLLSELTSRLPMSKDGATPVLDKAYHELAIAIIEAMWCGWLSQAKANRGAYARDWPDKFEEAICDAIKIGREYASSRP